MAAPAGVAYGRGDTASDSTGFAVALKIFTSLKKTKGNSFIDKCKNAKFTPDSIENHLKNIKKDINPNEGEWLQAYGKEYADSLSFFVNTCREIEQYNSDDCGKFIKAYIDNNIANIDIKNLEKEKKRTSSENESKETSPAPSETNASDFLVTQSHTSQSNSTPYPALQSELARLTHILYLLGALGGITFIFLLALFFKSQRPAATHPNDPVRDDRDGNDCATNNSNEQIGEKVQALEQTLKQLNKDVKERFPLPAKTQPATTTTMPPSKSTYPQPNATSGARTTPPFVSPSAGSVAEPNTPPKGFTTLYVSVKAGEPNTLFKQTPIFARDHLYEIHLKSPDAQEGELHICPHIGPEFARKFINQRMQYLKPCEILSALTNAEKISMVSSGVVLKRGSDWIVTTSPKVRLI